MVWMEPKEHSSDCYSCLTNITGITSKSKHTVKYPNAPSAMRPVPHNEVLPIPKPPANVIVDDEDSATDEADLEQIGETFDCDSKFEANCSSSKPHLLIQGDLNDLERYLNLSKKEAEILASRLKGWNLLQQGTKVCLFRNRQDEFKCFFLQRKFSSIL
jgi:hypothetical protein